MKNLSQQLYADKTAAALIAANLFTTGLAVLQQWPLADLIWVYWGQSLIIGLFNFRRILDLEHFSTDGFLMDGKPVAPTRETQRTTAFFFLIHYSFFHLVYLLFLFSEGGFFFESSVFGLAVSLLAFAWNHHYSYVANRKRDMSRTPNIGTIMMFPYARVIPMHLTIIFGALLSTQSRLQLVLFLGLKTVADVIMHMREHADARLGQSPAPEQTHL